MDLTELARGYYRAFETGDRAFVENNLAPGFTFTSPFDDHIGREAYFRRCWRDNPCTPGSISSPSCRRATRCSSPKTPRCACRMRSIPRQPSAMPN